LKTNHLATLHRATGFSLFLHIDLYIYKSTFQTKKVIEKLPLQSPRWQAVTIPLDHAARAKKNCLVAWLSGIVSEFRKGVNFLASTYVCTYTMYDGSVHPNITKKY
jgi:hypothetical protein